MVRVCFVPPSSPWLTLLHVQAAGSTAPSSVPPPPPLPQASRSAAPPPAAAISASMARSRLTPKHPARAASRHLPPSLPAAGGTRTIQRRTIGPACSGGGFLGLQQMLCCACCLRRFRHPS
jgi:hypothetical protein